MKTYKITLKPKSSIITPFQADTIFGSVCWAIKYLNSEKSLEEFLNSFQEEPTLVLSDGLSEGYLPKPILKPVSHQQMKGFAKKYFGEGKKNLVKCLMEIKRLQKEKYIPVSIFDELKNGLSEMKLLDKLLQERKLNQPQEKRTLVFRNTISRTTGAVLSEGGLHPDEEIFYGTNFKICVFLKTDYFDIKKLENIFGFIALSGFGRSASSGKGAMDLIEIKKEKIIVAEKPNAFMSISSFIPAENDPIEGYYQIITKYGKLGGDYAKSKNPFKKPVIMFKAGSIFFDEPIKEYYGRLINNIHSDEKIKHYAYAFPVGARINEDI